MPVSSTSEPGAAEYLAMIRRRLPIIVLVALGVALVAGLVAARQTPSYKATALLLLEPNQISPTPLGSTSGVVNPSDADRVLQTQAALVTGRAVRVAVEQAIGPDAPTASARQVPQTNILEVAATATTPENAAKATDAYVDAYLAERESADADRLSKASDEVRARIAEVDEQLADVAAQLAAAPATAPNTQPDVAAHLVPVQQSLLQRSNSLHGQLDQLEVQSALANGGVHQVGKTELPKSDSGRSKTLTIAIGLGVGLLAGLGLALAAELLDSRVRDEAEVGRMIPGVPILGLAGKRRRRLRRGEVLDEPGGDVAESYRTISLAVLASENGRRLPLSLLVAAPERHAGREATNLAAAIAGIGNRVALVDADPRTRTLPTGLGPDGGGIGRLLRDPGSASTTADLPALGVVISGAAPDLRMPNHDELREMFSTITPAPDVIVLSGAPINRYGDASLFGSEVDGVVLVTQLGHTTRAALRRAVERLTAVNARIVGVVVFH